MFLSKALVFSTHKVLAVDSLEPTNGKMTSSHLLEMLNKRVVHGSAVAADVRSAEKLGSP